MDVLSVQILDFLIITKTTGRQNYPNVLSILFSGVSLIGKVQKGIHIYSFSLHRPLEEPKVISAFSGKQAGKHVVHIACGSTYSAAITAEGELYTWGRGNYGRLGHGMSPLSQPEPAAWGCLF